MNWAVRSNPKIRPNRRGADPSLFFGVAKTKKSI
jgi:hypothetical protein